MGRQGSPFKNYDEYMASPEWQAKREEAIQAWGDKCALCDGPAQHIHHLNYGMPYGEEDPKRDLMPLCSACHDRQHGRPATTSHGVLDLEAMYPHADDEMRRDAELVEIDCGPDRPPIHITGQVLNLFCIGTRFSEVVGDTLLHGSNDKTVLWLEYQVLELRKRIATVEGKDAADGKTT